MILTLPLFVIAAFALVVLVSLLLPELELSSFSCC